MIIILTIFNIVLLLIGLFLIYQAKNIKTQRTEQANQIKQQIANKQAQLYSVQKEIKNYENYLNSSRQQLNILHSEQTQLNEQLKQKQIYLNDYYDTLKKQTDKAFQEYINTLDKYYEGQENIFNNKIKKIKDEYEQAENNLIQIKNIIQAANASRLRQQEKEQKQSFYCIRISKQQINDILYLQQLKTKLYDPTIISKIIWSSYIINPTSAMCHRILGTTEPVCGIYKITNKITGEVYIGQSVNIAERWKTHIKCGLGIDASSTNKLYNTMQQSGVWNFTFEVLQKCSRDKLNKKERFWIEMYQSNKVGMNTTKGNK